MNALMEGLIEGLQAAYPGLGTPTALQYIGRGRGILRGRLDTDDTYAGKLRAWLDRWETAGSMQGLARELYEYLGLPLRIVNRAGHWLSIDSLGIITTTQAMWDWDSVSHPERAGFWSEMWIIVYTTVYIL